MHRFNKASELLGDVMGGRFKDQPREEALARIYVWLRFSAIRQLTWQRNYNTQVGGWGCRPPAPAAMHALAPTPLGLAVAGCLPVQPDSLASSPLAPTTPRSPASWARPRSG